MADGKVNLVFSTIAQLKGINAVSDGVKTVGRGLKDFGDAGTKIVGSLSAEFSGLGKAMAAPFSILTEMAKGGIWGAVAQGISMAVTAFINWRKEIARVREERRKFLKEQEEGHARRVAKYAEDAAKREAAAHEARMKAMKEYAAAQTKMWTEFERNSIRAQSLDAQMRAARRRLDVAGGGSDAADQEKVDAANDKVANAKTTLLALSRRQDVGSATVEDVEAAKKALHVAYAELLAVEAEVAKAGRERAAAAAKERADAEDKAGQEYLKAEREFAEQLRREEKEARDRKIAAMRESAEKMQEEASALDMAIAAQRKLADAWEANALKARGRDFGDAERERRDDAEGKAAAAFARRNRADERRAQRIAAAGRHARPEDRAWLARFREWRDAQDPRNNPAAKAAEALQKRRDALQQDIKKTLDDIKAELKTANTFG